MQATGSRGIPAGLTAQAALREEPGKHAHTRSPVCGRNSLQCGPQSTPSPGKWLRWDCSGLQPGQRTARCGTLWSKANIFPTDRVQSHQSWEGGGAPPQSFGSQAGWGRPHPRGPPQPLSRAAPSSGRSPGGGRRSLHPILPPAPRERVSVQGVHSLSSFALIGLVWVMCSFLNQSRWPEQRDVL